MQSCNDGNHRRVFDNQVVVEGVLTLGGHILTLVFTAGLIWVNSDSVEPWGTLLINTQTLSVTGPVIYGFVFYFTFTNSPVRVSLKFVHD